MAGRAGAARGDMPPRLGGACEANGRVREGRRGSPVPAWHDKGKGSRPARSPDGRAGKVWRDGTQPGRQDWQGVAGRHAASDGESRNKG